MTMPDDINFEFVTDRLHLVKVNDDPLLNVNLWHYLNTFEQYIFGVLMQYHRITSDLDIFKALEMRRDSIRQASLDIYYYILTWDKVKKIYEKIKNIINRLNQTVTSLPNGFSLEFRTWKKRMDHLFAEFNTDVRNEYEHPSLESYSSGNIIMWGNITSDGAGNLKAHVGKECFAAIRVEHCHKLQQLRTDLVDLFVKHFSEKLLTKELIGVRKYIEEHLETILEELKKLREEDKIDEFNELLRTLIMYDIHLAKEGVPLTQSVKERLYSPILDIDVC